MNILSYDKGIDVIAVAWKFDEPPENNYKDGEGVDIVCGVEAIISHYLTRELQIHVVHAPAFDNITITKDVLNKNDIIETETYEQCYQYLRKMKWKKINVVSHFQKL